MLTKIDDKMFLFGDYGDDNELNANGIYGNQQIKEKVQSQAKLILSTDRQPKAREQSFERSYLLLVLSASALLLSVCAQFIFGHELPKSRVFLLKECDHEGGQSSGRAVDTVSAKGR